MTVKETLKESALFAKEIVLETLWPTRCVVCDTPGTLLCDSCYLHLPYLDQLQACPQCGAPFGYTLCSECNSFVLGYRCLPEYPLQGCTSVTQLTEVSRKMVLTYKNKGDVRLARTLAELMASILPPTWKPHACLVGIPARAQAIQQRGFDHIALLLQELSQLTGIPSLPALATARQADQRSLNANERRFNMTGAFTLAKPYANTPPTHTHLPRRIILVDDVITTGATIFAAADILHTAGVSEIYGLSFTRA